MRHSSTTTAARFSADLSSTTPSPGRWTCRRSTSRSSRCPRTRARLARRGSVRQASCRARQVGDAIWGGLATSVGELRTLPVALREEIGRAFTVDTLAATEMRLSDGGMTEKALHTLGDGALVESVLMHYPARAGSRERHTVCISSQAGCAVGCPFCATGELGFTRDLEAAEIIDQVRHAARRLAADGRRLTNVV